MLSEAKQKIFQARWCDKICEKMVQSERELSISTIYVSIWDSTFSSRTTSKILEESESKKFDPKPAIKILNENVRSNRDRNRRRHQKKESKRQQNNLHFCNKILNENSAAKNLRSPRFNLGVTLFPANQFEQQHVPPPNKLLSVPSWPKMFPEKISTVRVRQYLNYLPHKTFFWLEQISKKKTLNASSMSDSMHLLDQLKIFGNI